MANDSFSEEELIHIAAFKGLVFDQEDAVDPDKECDWADLSYGFFLGRGLKPERANEIAAYVTYNPPW